MNLCVGLIVAVAPDDDASPSSPSTTNSASLELTDELEEEDVLALLLLDDILSICKSPSEGDG